MGDQALLLASYPEKLLPKGRVPSWERKREHGSGRGSYLSSNFDITNDPPHPKPWRPFQKSEILLKKQCIGAVRSGITVGGWLLPPNADGLRWSASHCPSKKSSFGNGHTDAAPSQGSRG